MKPSSVVVREALGAAPGAAVAAPAPGFGVSQATHFVLFASFLTIHASHSHEFDGFCDAMILEKLCGGAGALLLGVSHAAHLVNFSSFFIIHTPHSHF